MSRPRRSKRRLRGGPPPAASLLLAATLTACGGGAERETLAPHGCDDADAVDDNGQPVVTGVAEVDSCIAFALEADVSLRAWAARVRDGCADVVVAWTGDASAAADGELRQVCDVALTYLEAALDSSAVIVSCDVPFACEAETMTCTVDGLETAELTTVLGALEDGGGPLCNLGVCQPVSQDELLDCIGVLESRADALTDHASRCAAESALTMLGELLMVDVDLRHVALELTFAGGSASVFLCS